MSKAESYVDELRVQSDRRSEPVNDASSEVPSDSRSYHAIGIRVKMVARKTCKDGVGEPQTGTI